MEILEIVKKYNLSRLQTRFIFLVGFCIYGMIFCMDSGFYNAIFVDSYMGLCLIVSAFF